jgi:hypothetical protein
MRKFSLLVLALSLAACRDSGGGDDVVTPDAPGGGAQTVYDVQNNAMTAGTKVALKGVIVTAIDNYGGKKGDFWVQEADGGEYSGVHVYGAPVDQVGALALGDIVDISGAQKAEFALSTDTSGDTLTELEPVDGGTMQVTKTGSGPQVQPKVIDALAIGQLTDFMARHAEWEKWEGVLVTVNNVSAFGDDDYVSSKCPGTTCPDDTLYKFDITGDIVVESALAAHPTPKVTRGTCLAGVTGVVDYFFDYLIYPRQTSEIMTGGTSCPAENNATLCGDTMDNDGNGFKDCADIGCVVASATCRMDEDALITEIQGGTKTDTYVKVNDVVVMAVSVNKNDIWVSDTKDAASNEGLHVHFNVDVPNTVTVGKTVTIIGKVIEFNDNPPTGTNTLTEISGYDIQVGAAAVQTPVAVTGQLATALNVDVTGEPYESVLVTLENVKLKTVGTDASFHVGTMTQGVDFKFDDAIYRIIESGTGAVPAGTCYDAITGIWSYNVYDNNWVFFPIDAGDTVGGSCP